MAEPTNGLPARCPYAAGLPFPATAAAVGLHPPVPGECSRAGRLMPIAPDDFRLVYCADAAPGPTAEARSRPYDRAPVLRYRGRQA